MTEKPRPGRSWLPEMKRLLDEHSPLVRQIAHGMARNFPDSVLEDDLAQDGMLGLMDAIVRASRDMTAQQFQHYASKRIRGAILDGLRALDWGSRRVRRQMRQIEHTIQHLSQSLGRQPLEQEVADAMHLPLAEYQRTLQRADSYVLISLDDLLIQGNDTEFEEEAAVVGDPSVILQRAVFQRALMSALTQLSAQEAKVMRLYYEKSLTMREIAQSQGVTEGRVSQIHNQAIARLRAAILGEDGGARMLALRQRRR